MQTYKLRNQIVHELKDMHLAKTRCWNSDHALNVMEIVDTVLEFLDSSPFLLNKMEKMKFGQDLT